MATSVSNTFTIDIQPRKPAANLPAWVPPAGFFADVPMLNNPQDVMPAIYALSSGDTTAMDSPFIQWGGSAVVRDYSALGAQVYYSTGHESSLRQPNIQFALICDFSSLTWSTSNVPRQPNALGDFVNGLAPDGTPYCAHTYLTLQEFPTAWGGGKQGSLAAFFQAGSNYDNKINLLDLSQAQLGYSQLATRQPTYPNATSAQLSSKGNNTGTHAITVIDYARQGWWVATTGSVDYTLFVNKSGTIAEYPALGGNLANGTMVLCAALNLLIAVDGGYRSGQYAGTGYRSLHVRDLTTGKVTKSLTLGPVPSINDGYDGSKDSYHRPDVLGLQWVDELGCIIGLDQSVSPPVIVKLAPPAQNPATGQWTWSVVTSLRHWPEDKSGQAELQVAQNNYWSKFRWVPALHAFVFCTAKNRKPQVVKLN